MFLCFLFMVKMKKFFRNSFIFFILINFSLNIIVIPFKTYNQKEPSTFTSPSEIMKYWGKNLIYTNILIGTPPQNITVFLNSQSFGINLFYHMCDYPSEFDKKKSSSFVYHKIINSYDKMKNASLINETAYLYNDLNLKSKKTLKNFSLIYSDNEESAQGSSYENHPYTCMNIGLEMGWSSYNDYPVNLPSQLKKKYSEETYDFTIEYNASNLNEGRIVIGSEPHLYDPNEYFAQQYRLTGAVENNNRNLKDFFLNFDNIYVPYTVKSTGKQFNETISMVKSIKFTIDLGIIYGPYEYKNIIGKNFFNDMIKEGKCDKDNNEDFSYYFCYKNKAENDIKNNFPNLYFEMKQFHKTFVFTYEDLFREKNDKLYFLVFFKTNYFGTYFEMGKMFLRKYNLTFNHDTRMIGYYNVDLPGGKNNGENEEKSPEQNIFNSIYTWIGIFLIIVIFGILGFFLGKYIYDKVRKKRMNEIDDNFVYNSKQNNEDENENNKLYDNNEGEAN